MVGRSLITSLSLVRGRCRRIMGLARAEVEGELERWDRLGGLFRFFVLFFIVNLGERSDKDILLEDLIRIIDLYQYI